MTLSNVSASQLKTFRACRRKWHWQKVGKQPRMNHASARRGTAIHEALELYLKNGSIADAVQIDIATGNATGLTGPKCAKEGPPSKDASEGLEWWNTARFVKAATPFIPEPAPKGPEVMLEAQFRLATLDGQGPPWLGFIDLLEENPVRVTDYKSTSDIRRYALTPAELLEDPQAMSYARFVFENLPDTFEVELRWLYLETKNKVKVNTREVTVTVDRDYVEMYWTEIQPTVQEMVELYQIKNSKEVPPTTSECSNYGGCQFLSLCGVGLIGEIFSEGAKRTKKEKGNTMGLLQRMKAAKEGGEKKTEAETDPEAILPPDAPSRETSDEDAEAQASKGKKKKAAAKPKAEKKPAKKKAAAKPKAEPAEPSEPSAEGFTLYIDCAPLTESYTLFEAWLQPIINSINEASAEETGKTSLWLLSFGDQKAAITTAIEAAMDTIPGDMVASSAGPYARDVLPLLIPHAARVVRGLR